MKSPLISCLRAGISALAVGVLVGCASLSPEERDAKRAELDKMGDKAIATLLDTRPRVREFLDKALGYIVVDMRVTKIPMVGAGTGVGVVVDKRSNTRSYVKVSRFEVGGGLGAQRFKVVILFFDEKLLETAALGAWHFDAGAEAGAGTVSSEGSMSDTREGYKAYKLAEEGAVVTVTVRVAHAEPYLE